MNAHTPTIRFPVQGACALRRLMCGFLPPLLCFVNHFLPKGTGIYFLGYVGLLILLVHPFTLAQLSRATISGTVTDESGAILPGVSITIENLEMGTTRETVADDQGSYSAPNLTVGAYSLRAELPGFSTAVRTGIQLTVGRNASLH